FGFFSFSISCFFYFVFHFSSFGCNFFCFCRFFSTSTCCFLRFFFVSVVQLVEIYKFNHCHLSVVAKTIPYFDDTCVSSRTITHFRSNCSQPLSSCMFI